VNDWRPDNNELVVARYGGLTIWDIRKEKPVESLNYRGSVLRIAICPRGRYIATADQNSAVHFWRTETWLDAEMSGYPHLVTSMSWDCSDPGPEDRTPTFLKGSEDCLTRCVLFAPNSTLCAFAGEAGGMTVQDVTKTESYRIGELGSPVTSLAWLPDATVLFASTSTGTLSAFGE